MDHILARNESIHQKVCGQMQNLSAHKGKKIEHRVISVVTHTREAMGCSKHGFCVGIAKNTKRV
jgi:hypothetical protein